VDYDPQYEVYVAQCLQTGHLVTADDDKTVKEMITELLHDEVSLAVKNDGISRLLSHPASSDLFYKWDMVKQAMPERIEQTTIEISGEELNLLVGHNLLPGHDNRTLGVKTEIKIATGKTTRTA
ncbi:MAG TPA: hypothetical protein VFP59_11780, partial [Candidatus Angelobacter sp.]|nr:hypothetical protein [Candidatus Angelobacter sp.]